MTDAKLQASSCQLGTEEKEYLFGGLFLGRAEMKYVGGVIDMPSNPRRSARVTHLVMYLIQQGFHFCQKSVSAVASV